MPPPLWVLSRAIGPHRSFVLVRVDGDFDFVPEASGATAYPSEDAAIRARSRLDPRGMYEFEVTRR